MSPSALVRVHLEVAGRLNPVGTFEVVDEDENEASRLRQIATALHRLAWLFEDRSDEIERGA